MRTKCLTMHVEELCVRMNIARRRVWVRLPKETRPRTAATRPKTDLKKT
jgi:hypothetical protein